MTNCGKMNFISKSQAASYINSIKAAKRQGAYKKHRPYKCNRCDYFHTTTATKKQIRDYFKRTNGVMV